MNDALLPLSICIIAGLLWHAAMRARELAVLHAGELCARHGAQMLDQSVALHNVRALWRGGPPRLARSYRFELSYDGDDRHRASLTMIGNRLVDYSLPTRDDPFAAAAPLSSPPPLEPPRQPRGPTFSDGNVIPITRGRKTLH